MEEAGQPGKSTDGRGRAGNPLTKLAIRAALILIWVGLFISGIIWITQALPASWVNTTEYWKVIAEVFGSLAYVFVALLVAAGLWWLIHEKKD